MFRLSSFSRITALKQSLKSLKDINADNTIHSKYAKQIEKTVAGAQIQCFFTRTSSVDDNQKNSRTRQLKKDLQKLCSRIQSRLTQKHKLGMVAAGAGLTLDADLLPEAPAVPEITETVATALNAAGEPTFASLGLGGWSPVGMIQQCFEYLHADLGIEWWGVIAIGTIVVRMLLFPLVVISQRNAAKMNNYMPQMQAIQLKMTEARQTGNQLEAARYSQEMMIFMKEKSLNPLKNLVVPLAQMPIFVSFFMGLRQMTNVPVASLETGGLWWFENLIVPDQFFLLPVITSVTLWATIELGTDTAKLTSQNLHMMKYFLRALPVVIFPFTMNFPGAILCYWVASNFISLAQVGVLKIPAVRDYLNIEQLIDHKPQNLPIQPKGFTAGMRDSWTNMKITRELEDRRRVDELKFQKAGKGPIVKTYKYNPTKVAPKLEAKKR